MIRRFFGFSCFIFVSLAMLVSTSPAAMMNWGDFSGDDLTYESVTESNGEPNLLYSMPSVVGNVLEFDPVNFFADADPGPDSDITDSELSTVLQADAGFGIDNIQISESGDFTLAGIPGAFGSAAVGAAFFFEVLEIDGVLVGDGPEGNVNMVFTTGAGPNGGEYFLPGDAGNATIWEGEAFIDVAATLADAGIAGQATRVRLAFNNSLAAAADAGASSFIKKKQIGGIIVRVNVPEPSSLALASLAALGFGVVVMRRRLG